MLGIKDVAKATGVSLSTVSNVLNGRKNVGEETRKRVLDACKEMNYYPNAAGKNLKSGDSKTVLFNFSDFDRSFYLDIINGISDYVNANGYDLMICTHKSCEKYMRNRMTSGCIILDEKMSNDVLQAIAREQYPIIVLDRMVGHPFIKSVIVNNYDSMTQLVEGIIDRGYRKFAFLGGKEHTDDTKERYRAFIDVLEKHHINFPRERYFAGDYREESGYKVAKILMLSEELPEVLVCANDNMALGAMKAFKENGIRVPEDISITGFDDCALAAAMGLTTVKIPNYERGYLAAQYLLENMKGNGNVEPFKISAKVQWRKSISSKI